MKLTPIVVLFIVPAAICAFLGGHIIDRAVWGMSTHVHPGRPGVGIPFVMVLCGLAAIVLPVVAAIREHTQVQKQSHLPLHGSPQGEDSRLTQVADEVPTSE